MTFKKALPLLLVAVLVFIVAACSPDEQESAVFVNNFDPSDMSTYYIEGEHSFYDVSMYEVLNLRYLENFNGILYFGFPSCPWCQAAVPVIHDAAQAAGVNIFYISRAGALREGDWLDWDAEMAWWLYENGMTNMAWLYTRPDEDADEEEIENFVPERIRPNINVPQIVHLRNGVIIDQHRGTFEGHDHEIVDDVRFLPELGEDEYNNLFDRYTEIFRRVFEACPINSGEDCD